MFNLSKKSMMMLMFCAIMLLTACTGNHNGNKNANGSPEASASSDVTPVTDAAVETVGMLKIAGGDSGYPSPFAFSNSGPFGYLRNSFIFDTLTWKDDTGVIPWLAKSWELSEDGLTYTFQLEEDVKWHDGEKFTADDVVFSFGYYKTYPFNWNGDITQIKSVEKINDYTVAFHLNNKYAPFLSDLVGIVPIIPEHVWATVTNPVEYREDAALVGTGPYQLEEYDSASGQYLYAANENFFKGQVIVKEIAYVAVSNKLLALQNGEIDAMYTAGYGDVQTAEAAGLSSIKSEPAGSVVRISFNMEHSQLGDKRLRQAIAYALDRTEISSKITGGEPMVGNAGVVPTDSPWYNEEVKQYEYNTAEAERILDELGYTKNANGMREDLKLNLMTSSTMQDSVMMQEMLKKVGIELNLVQLDSAAFAVALGENKYDIALTGHIGASGDADYLRLWFSGKAANMWSSRGKSLELGEFHELADLQMQELDEMKRKEIIDQMQDILAEELPTLVLYHRPFYEIHNADKFDKWKNTYGGIADGMPLWENKVVFVNVEK
ncbi:ABC transporter substrate-binding protein [Paenibacillus nasutitermitis]|uniref:Peptide ABC transporter substrate-binding protein n=1 Tax=Paenibacillus nasutitermitis TaxID=1652958 RepID=A0A916ZKZ2_9BACL|nr:ABC transporter substrate-binding protein [Paenibacillus nasutitermitis]GGE02841.1 peptide ABC transporter substrate-binding protein [Paenibacillus nasutitermitis]